MQLFLGLGVGPFVGKASKRYRLNEGYARDYGHLRPFIVDHESDRRKLVCLLTGHVLNKIPDQLALHVNSKKFVRLKAERQARDETRRKKKAARAAKLAARHEAKQGQGEGEDDNLSRRPAPGHRIARQHGAPVVAGRRRRDTQV